MTGYSISSPTIPRSRFSSRTLGPHSSLSYLPVADLENYSNEGATLCDKDPQMFFKGPLKVADGKGIPLESFSH